MESNGMAWLIHFNGSLFNRWCEWQSYGETLMIDDDLMNYEIY